MLNLLANTGWRRIAKIIFIITVLYSIGSVNQVSALSESSTITITATIAPTRIMMINADGIIQKIFSNTTQPTPLTAYTATNQPITITPAIMDQYRSIAKHHNLYKVGVVYELAKTKSLSKNQLGSAIGVVTSISLKSLNLSDLFK